MSWTRLPSAAHGVGRAAGPAHDGEVAAHPPRGAGRRCAASPRALHAPDDGPPRGAGEGLLRSLQVQVALSGSTPRCSWERPTMRSTHSAAAV
jgi:hypothetical protein